MNKCLSRNTLLLWGRVILQGGIDKLTPVYVDLTGCLPTPKAVIDATTKLPKEISREVYEDQIGSQEDN